MELELGTNNEHSLEFKMRDIGSFVKLLEAVKQMEKILRLGFNRKGLFVNEFGCGNALVLFASLEADEFDNFKTSGHGVICVETEDILKVIRNNSQDDSLRLVYNHKKPKSVRIEIVRDKADPNDESTYTFEMRTLYLEEDERTMFTAAEEAFDAEAKVSVRDVQNFIASLISIESGALFDAPKDFGLDGFIHLSVNQYMITIEKGAGTILGQAKIVMLTSKGKAALLEQGEKPTKDKFIDPWKRMVLPGTIKKQFMLKHLQQMNKFFLINPNKDATLTVYMKKEPPTYPVVFGINVGDMGYSNIALSPHEEYE